VTGAQVVRRFFEAMEARDWDAAASRLAPAVEVEMPATGERFVGGAYLAFQREYPEGWSIDVLEVLGDERVAARIRVDHDSQVFLCAGFYDVADDVIQAGVEHWVTLAGETPPAWRARLSATGHRLSLQRRER
jgi:limonene-1,2-epoxide hydrolase